MRSKSLSLSDSLPTYPFTINFPTKQFQLTLDLPAQIKVSELTQIIKNLTKMHQKYRLGVSHQPKYLCDGQNLIFDCFLMDKSTQQLDFTTLLSNKPKKQLIKGLQLGIVYVQKQMKLSHNYDCLYKIINHENKDNSQIIVRSLVTGQLLSLHRTLKNKLDFTQFQQLIIIRNKLIKWQKDGLQIACTLYQTFQTQQYLNIVTSFCPIRLHLYKISDRQQLEICISQIARIIHILDKENISHQYLNLQDFSLTFSCKVIITGILSLQYNRQSNNSDSNIKIIDQQPVYTRTLIRLWQQLMKTCEISIIELYLPFHHYLKNKKINCYSQFIRYFQIQRKQAITPRTNKNLITQQIDKIEFIKKIFKNTAPLPMEMIPQHSNKFYQPKTDVFRYKADNQNQSSLLNPQYSQIQNTSTIKKQKPTQKLGNKRKGTYINKSFKTKKHIRQISQFLIDK